MVRNLKDSLRHQHKTRFRCIQEKSLDFIIRGYFDLHKDRVNGNGGGCAIFIKQNLYTSQYNTGVRRQCCRMGK